MVSLSLSVGITTQVFLSIQLLLTLFSSSPLSNTLRKKTFFRKDLEAAVSDRVTLSSVQCDGLEETL